MGQENKTDKMNILVLANALSRCKDGNYPGWYQKHFNTVIETLKATLPHGSGINAQWDFCITDKAIICSNSYHHMNDIGYYCNWIDFTVKIKTGHRNIHGKLDFSVTGSFGKHQDLKDYLYENIGYSLKNL